MPSSPSVISAIFNEAITQKASDVHLVVGYRPIVRVNGELFFLEGRKEFTSKEMASVLSEIASEDQIARFESIKELDLGYENADGNRFRVNFHYERGNIGMVARVIPDKIPSLEDLNLPEQVRSLLGLKQGLILVTGPTGCGKSSSLAAMIDYLNDNFSYNIITLEDPIEYLFTGKKSIIIQRQLGSDMINFSEGLKHALRQDPNVIMVGEMRDLDTIATTITLAETGHLVLATLHTYNAAQTIDRIIDIFPPYQQNQVRTQLSLILSGVISQRLLPRVNGGRIAAREIMINTPAIANQIREGKVAQIKTVIETSSRDGMVTLDQDIVRLVKANEVSREVAAMQMLNPEMLKKFT